MRTRAPYHWPPWLMLLVWWALYALVYAANIVGMSDQAGQQLTWRAALTYSLAGWLTWVPLSMAIMALTRRFPIVRERFWRAIVVHGVAVVLVVVLRAAYVGLTNPWLHWYSAEFSAATLLLDSVRNNFLTAWLVIGVAHAWVFSERAHEREVLIAALEAKLAQAKLDALSNQLKPHFLFNALNSVAELVHHDAEAADRMLVSLSNLLRRSLSNQGDNELPLAVELELLEHYLDIEKVRLAERLQIEINIDGACRAALVPVLVLQTLMENAVVHGVAKMPLGGRVGLYVSQVAEMLILSVTNDCDASLIPEVDAKMIGASEAAIPAGPGHGLGLNNIEQRLQYLYGAKASMTVQRVPGQYCVRISLPFKTATSVKEAPLSTWTA